MKICMIGAGYVGLVSAACFAEFGWTVVCVDNDPARIALLKSGGVPIYEPGLDVLVERNVAERPLAILLVAVGCGPTGRHRISCGGHAHASWRWLCRSELYFRGDQSVGAASDRRHGGRHQINRAGRHQPGGQAAFAGAPTRARYRGLLQSRIPARGIGHPRFYPPRPGADWLR